MISSPYEQFSPISVNNNNNNNNNNCDKITPTNNEPKMSKKGVHVHHEQPLVNRGGQSTEPDFDDRTSDFPLDVLQDQLCELRQANQSRIDNALEYDMMCLSSRFVDYLFTICARLSIAQDVKYIAALIFDRFLLTHIDQMYTYVVEMDKLDDQAKLEEWKRVETTIAHQLTLRALSCVQIASKISSYHYSLSTKMVVSCLMTLGLAYTEEAVANSEIRVLKTIDFRLPNPSSPLVYVEILLKLLKLADDTFKATEYWGYCMLLLDVVFLRHDTFYRQLIEGLLGSAAQSVTKERMAFVKADWMLTSAGVIVAASMCVEGNAQIDKLIDYLQKLTSAPANDIRDFSVALKDHILS